MPCVTVFPFFSDSADVAVRRVVNYYEQGFSLFSWGRNSRSRAVVCANRKSESSETNGYGYTSCKRRSKDAACSHHAGGVEMSVVEVWSAEEPILRDRRCRGRRFQGRTRTTAGTYNHASVRL